MESEEQRKTYPVTEEKNSNQQSKPGVRRAPRGSVKALVGKYENMYKECSSQDSNEVQGNSSEEKPTQGLIVQNTQPKNDPAGNPNRKRGSVKKSDLWLKDINFEIREDITEDIQDDDDAIMSQDKIKKVESSENALPDIIEKSPETTSKSNTHISNSEAFDENPANFSIKKTELEEKELEVLLENKSPNECAKEKSEDNDDEKKCFVELSLTSEKTEAKKDIITQETVDISKVKSSKNEKGDEFGEVPKKHKRHHKKQMDAREEKLLEEEHTEEKISIEPEKFSIGNEESESLILSLKNEEKSSSISFNLNESHSISEFRPSEKEEDKKESDGQKKKKSKKHEKHGNDTNVKDHESEIKKTKDECQELKISPSGENKILESEQNLMFVDNDLYKIQEKTLNEKTKSRKNESSSEDDDENLRKEPIIKEIKDSQHEKFSASKKEVIKDNKEESEIDFKTKKKEIDDKSIGKCDEKEHLEIKNEVIKEEDVFTYKKNEQFGENYEFEPKIEEKKYDVLSDEGIKHKSSQKHVKKVKDKSFEESDKEKNPENIIPAKIDEEKTIKDDHKKIVSGTENSINLIESPKKYYEEKPISKIKEENKFPTDISHKNHKSSDEDGIKTKKNKELSDDASKIKNKKHKDKKNHVDDSGEKNQKNKHQEKDPYENKKKDKNSDKDSDKEHIINNEIQKSTEVDLKFEPGQTETRKNVEEKKEDLVIEKEIHMEKVEPPNEKISEDVAIKDVSIEEPKKVSEAPADKDKPVEKGPYISKGLRKDSDRSRSRERKSEGKREDSFSRKRGKKEKPESLLKPQENAKIEENLLIPDSSQDKKEHKEHDKDKSDKNISIEKELTITNPEQPETLTKTELKNTEKPKGIKPNETFALKTSDNLTPSNEIPIQMITPEITPNIEPHNPLLEEQKYNFESNFTFGQEENKSPPKNALKIDYENKIPPESAENKYYSLMEFDQDSSSDLLYKDLPDSPNMLLENKEAKKPVGLPTIEEKVLESPVKAKTKDIEKVHTPVFAKESSKVQEKSPAFGYGYGLPKSPDIVGKNLVEVFSTPETHVKVPVKDQEKNSKKPMEIVNTPMIPTKNIEKPKINPTPLEQLAEKPDITPFGSVLHLEKPQETQFAQKKASNLSLQSSSKITQPQETTPSITMEKVTEINISPYKNLENLSSSPKTSALQGKKPIEENKINPIVTSSEKPTRNLLFPPSPVFKPEKPTTKPESQIFKTPQKPAKTEEKKQKPVEIKPKPESEPQHIQGPFSPYFDEKNPDTPLQKKKISLSVSNSNIPSLYPMPLEDIINEIDVLCVNCYECVPADEVDLHSKKCLKPIVESQDFSPADIRIRKLLKAIASRKIISSGIKYSYYCQLEEYSVAILEQSMVKFT